MKYTIELLTPIVAESTSIADVLRKLGLQQAGGNYSHIKRRIREFGISIEHFDGGQQDWRKGKKFPFERTSPDKLLILRTKGQPITNGHVLRKALIEKGREYICEICGQGPVWNDKPLVLPVDHKNGCRWDNREENLRFLCGHCHSQTETFSGRNTKRDVVE